jgi:hypothetical protein
MIVLAQSKIAALIIFAPEGIASGVDLVSLIIGSFVD